jgi:hypothetical protein
MDPQQWTAALVEQSEARACPASWQKGSCGPYRLLGRRSSATGITKVPSFMTTKCEEGGTRLVRYGVSWS